MAIVLVSGCGSSAPTPGPSRTTAVVQPLGPTPAVTQTSPSFGVTVPSAAAPAVPSTDNLGGRIAVTVTDDLVVRSQPRVSADSTMYTPYLPQGIELRVIGGPVEGSGYTWYEVVPISFVLQGNPASGWVAAAGKDGEPWIALTVVDADRGTSSVAGPVLPTGWHHELVCSASSTECQLHLYDAAGQERPGWPVTLAGGYWRANLAVGTDGIAYIACRIADKEVLLSAIDVGGASVPGWPIKVTGYPRRVEAGRNGSVYLGTVSEPGDGALSIHLFGPDGQARPGWPAVLPRTADFAVAPDGIVVGWWYEDVREGTLDLQAARTKYTMLGPNGRTLGGWPITSTGTGTAPVVVQDGSIFYVAGSEYPPDGKVWGRDRSGNLIDGWPYLLSPWYPPEPPELRPDGRLQFILGGYTLGDGTTPDSQVIVLTTTGEAASGWPYRTNASLVGVRCCIDCYSYIPHAVSADGTLYLAPWTDDRAEVVALDSRGRVVAGWPYRLPPGSRVAQVEQRSTERIVVTLRDCSTQEGCCSSDASWQITLTPAGERAP